MVIAIDSFSSALIDRMVTFAESASGARWSSFVWIDENFDIVSMHGASIPIGLEEHYRHSIRSIDPLSPRRLLDTGERVVMLQGHQDRLIGISSNEYCQYRNKFDIGDEIDLLFWSRGVLIAGLAMFRGKVDTPFSADNRDWECMRDYFEKSLTGHSVVRQHNIKTLLKERYYLNPREVEVVETLMHGATNADLAEVLDISISTVKNHVVNILNKFGVENRASIQAVAMALAYQ